MILGFQYYRKHYSFSGHLRIRLCSFYLEAVKTHLDNPQSPAGSLERSRGAAQHRGSWEYTGAQRKDQYGWEATSWPPVQADASTGALEHCSRASHTHVPSHQTQFPILPLQVLLALGASGQPMLISFFEVSETMPGIGM